MNATPLIFMLLLGMFAFFGLVTVLMLSNQATRQWGVSLALLMGVLIVAGGMVATWGVIAMPVARVDAPVEARVQDIAASLHAGHSHEHGESARPRIVIDEVKQRHSDLRELAKDLESLAAEEPINDPPLRVVSEPPEWSGRPREDYKSGSEFVKKLAAEHKADWVLIKRPQSKRGLDHCLAMERWVVREGVRQYVSKRSKTELGKRAPLGMSDAEIYKQFVKERQLVEKNGKHTIYTMLAINNEWGGDKLVKKTLALSKKPVSKQAIAPPKPAWVTKPPKRVGDTIRLVLDSGPYSTLDECYNDADDQLLARVELHALREAGEIGPDVSYIDPTGGYLNVSRSELRRRLVRDEHSEIVESSLQDMKRLYTLVEIAPTDTRWLVDLRRAKSRSENFGVVAGLAGSVVLLVGAVFGLLKLDEATRGYYTKRLFIGVPMAILGLLLLTALVAYRATNARATYDRPVPIPMTVDGHLEL